MRFALGLTIIGAASLMAGLIMILVGETLRLKSAHSRGLVAGGEIAAICGLASGVALLVVVIVGPADRPARRRGARPAPAGPVASGEMRGLALAPLPPVHMITPPAQTISAPPSGQMPAWPPSPVPAPQAEWSPLPPSAGFAPRAAAPAPEPAGAAWAPSGYADEGWHPQPGQGAGQWPQERWDPRARQDWDHQVGPGWQREAQGQWNPGPAYAWHATGADDWERGEADDWERGEAGDWGTDGHDDWTPDGHDGPGGEAWAHDGGGAWDADGRDRWIPPGQAPDGAADWAEPVRDDWAAGDRGVWIPDGGGWAHPAQDDWGRMAPASPYLAGPGDADDRAHDDPADDDTSPIPVIPAADAPGRPRPPAPPPEPEPFSVWEPARQHARRPDEPYRPEHAEPPSADTQEKIEQIKDLYETAESIGEDALVQHFEQLKTRQRSLIREFFEKAGLGPGNSAHPSQHAAGESAPDSASLPS
jgi:hypothetical protein